MVALTREQLEIRHLCVFCSQGLHPIFNSQLKIPTWDLCKLVEPFGIVFNFDCSTARAIWQGPTSKHARACSLYDGDCMFIICLGTWHDYFWFTSCETDNPVGL